MKNRTKLFVSGVAVAGAPLLSACPAPFGQCDPPTVLVPWDGGLADGGAGTSPDPETCYRLDCWSDCTVADAGLVACRHLCIGGRAPPGLMSLSACDGSAGSWLSRTAELEHASVRAFLQLAQELELHGLDGHAHYALRAARHEVSHARAVTRLALSRGRFPAPVAVEATPLRSLEEVALDNAVEGCGREAFGAALNLHQARHAADADVAAAFAVIAEEEAEHAQFSFNLAESLMRRLPLAQRGRIREAREVALSRAGGGEAPAACVRALGLMEEAQSRAAAMRILETTRI